MVKTNTSVETESVEISEKIIEAFKLLGANRHIAECYSFLLSNSECTLDQIQAQFHRKIKNLEFLLEKDWVIEEKGRYGLIYRPIPPEALLGDRIGNLAKEHKRLDEDLNILRTANAELKVMYEKGITNYVLNTPAEFYSWQSEMCRTAKKSILALTDRWMLALVRKDDIREAVKRGIEVRVLGRITDPDPDMGKELEKRALELLKTGAKIKILKDTVRIRFMLIDEISVFFAIRKKGEKHKGIWIKSPDFAINFVDEMNLIWKDAYNPEEKLNLK
ncbi:MAG: TrmB family transcriptional regulator [Promethearchaeota archaeon]